MFLLRRRVRKSPAIISSTKHDLTSSDDFTCCVLLCSPPLPEGIGWVICVALGCFFAALVSGMVYVVSPGLYVMLHWRMQVVRHPKQSRNEGGQLLFYSDPCPPCGRRRTGTSLQMNRRAITRRCIRRQAALSPLALPRLMLCPSGRGTAPLQDCVRATTHS